MANTPFGFSNSDDGDDDAARRDSSRGSGGGENPFAAFGGGAQGFDPAALGQMFTQMGQMLSGMGQGGPQSGPVNYDLAAKLARQQMGTTAPVRDGSRTAIRDSAHLAEQWLNEATILPVGAARTEAWTPQEWLDRTLDTWKRLCDPVAEQISGMWTSALPPEAQQMMGPMIGMLGSMGGMAFGSQLGQALGQLSKEVLTSTDIGLPLGPADTAALLPEAVAAFAEGIELPEREVLVFLAAREAAHHRLYSHVPWLRQRVLATVEEYARGIRMDFGAIEEAARGIDPSALTDPSQLEKILQQGTFEPQTTPEQKAALERLEVLLALVEGWVDTVVAAALGERIPGAMALAETVRRRRASGGPAEQTFATLVGLELRPRKVREAAELWRRLTDGAGIEGRDGVWAHPDLLPSAADLDDYASFVDRIVGGDTGTFDDPIAQLEEFERKRANEAAQERDSDDDDRRGGPESGPAPV
ncbi:zinc-dependent metalloprotease [Rhodococcoides corynebacterioides]|uniref:zinc-dependent metalloprotease n=1 Tax=Rhodococcoides corynebacterioides TaxID=53972 RepID=UPI003F80539B